jgi:hypothetical protein
VDLFQIALIGVPVHREEWRFRPLPQGSGRTEEASRGLRVAEIDKRPRQTLERFR